MKKIPKCKDCGEDGHYAISCRKTARKPIQSRSVKPKAVKAKTSKPKTKKPIKGLKKKLEKLVKDYVKVRDNYTCQRCGKKVEGVNCHASHVIPVSRSGYLQFEPLNMKVMCYHDHINWWHKHPVESGQWFRDTFPERWAYLEELHKQRLKPMKVWELEEKIEYYRNIILDKA